MELKACKGGSADIKLHLVAWPKTGKRAYSYQCKRFGKSAYACVESKDMDVEIWNDTMR